MLMTEYDYELDIEVQKEEAYESGVKDGEESGLQKGKELGLQEGKERVNELYSKLIQLGREEDVLKAIKDEGYRETLFGELE